MKLRRSADMPLRFTCRIRLLPGLRLNLIKSGASVSITSSCRPRRGSFIRCSWSVACPGRGTPS